MVSRKTALIRGVALLVIIALSFWTGFLLYPALGPRLTSTQRPASVQTTLSRDEYLKLSGEIYDTLSLQYYQQVDATKLLKGQVAGLVTHTLFSSRRPRPLISGRSWQGSMLALALSSLKTSRPTPSKSFASFRALLRKRPASRRATLSLASMGRTPGAWTWTWYRLA